MILFKQITNTKTQNSMTTKKDFELSPLKNRIPTGGFAIISEKSGISRGDVGKMFKGLKIKSTPKVVTATIEYVTELRDSLNAILAEYEQYQQTQN